MEQIVKSSKHNFAAMRTAVNRDVIWGTGNSRYIR